MSARLGLYFCSLLIVGTVNARAQFQSDGFELSTWAGVASPSEIADSQSVFSEIPTDGAPLSAGDVVESYLRGGALYYQGDKEAGIDLLTNAATQGYGDAALALGILAEEAGAPSVAFDWYSQGASQGSTKALTLVGRSQLYGVGTLRAPDEAVDALLSAFQSGDNSAAADLATASAFQWGRSIEIPTTKLWESALLSRELQPKLDYLRYLKAGGDVSGTNQPTATEAVRAIVSADPFWGPVASWDSLSQDERQNDEYLVEALDDSRQLGNIEATGRLGQLLAFGPDEGDRKVGLEYLFEAASAGEAAAYTDLGRYYLRFPEEGKGTDYVAASINTALLMGDVNAYQLASDLFIATGKPAAAYDAALLAMIAANQQTKLLAQSSLDQACANPAAKCEAILVGYVTSRQIDPTGGYNSLPSNDFSPHFGFASVLVPTADAPQKSGFRLLESCVERHIILSSTAAC